MNKFYRIFIVLTGAVLVASQMIDAQTTGKAKSNGILYKITGKGLSKPSYLFGTVHVICEKDMFSAEKLGRYMDLTDRVIMEIDMDNTGEIADLAKGLSVPDGKGLKELLTAEQYAKVDDLIMNSLGIHAESVNNISPVALQVMILSSPAVLGCSKPSAYELTLRSIANAKKKPMEGLETTAFQRKTVDEIPAETQAKMLYEMALDPEKAMAQFKELIAAYKMQDSEKLFETINNQNNGDQAIEKPLVDDRNKTWLPKIEKAIKEKSSFIAVGGGHLGGKDGMVNLLRNKGYRLEGIKL